MGHSYKSITPSRSTCLIAAMAVRRCGRDSLLKVLSRRPIAICPGALETNARSNSPLSPRERVGVRATPGTGFHVEKAAPFSTLRLAAMTL